MFVLAQMLSSGRGWQAALIIALAATFAWRSYKRTTGASRN
jgi:hypothetical protein